MIRFPAQIYKYPKTIWQIASKLKKTNNLLFIHTPKCAGSYAKNILSDLNIEILGPGHRTAKSNSKKINFTIFRNPIDRFESFLNFRLSEDSPRKDWPNTLFHVFKDTSFDINYIVSMLSDEQILRFHPYKTLNYWSKNIDIFIQINQLHNFLSFFGHEYNPEKYLPTNVSPKIRGSFNIQTKERLKQTYRRDIKLYNTLFPKDIIS